MNFFGWGTRTLLNWWKSINLNIIESIKKFHQKVTHSARKYFQVLIKNFHVIYWYWMRRRQFVCIFCDIDTPTPSHFDCFPLKPEIKFNITVKNVKKLKLRLWVQHITKLNLKFLYVVYILDLLFNFEWYFPFCTWGSWCCRGGGWGWRRGSRGTPTGRTSTRSPSGNTDFPEKKRFFSQSLL